MRDGSVPLWPPAAGRHTGAASSWLSRRPVATLGAAVLAAPLPPIVAAGAAAAIPSFAVLGATVASSVYDRLANRIFAAASVARRRWEEAQMTWDM